MWKFDASLLLLGICIVAFVSTGPVASEETTGKNDADGVTLSTELQPPPLLSNRGIVYLVNLFAVRNKSTESTNGKPGNDLTDGRPDIIGPLASLLLVVDEDDDEEITLDELAEGLADGIYEVEEPDSEKVADKVKVNSVKPDAQVDKLKKPKKIRRKRSLWDKCYSCGGGGGGGGGGHRGGGQRGQGGYSVVPIVVIPVSVNDGRGRGGGGHRGGHRGGHGGGGYNHGDGYNQGGGYNHGGGGGGGGGYAQAQAQASASSSSW